MSELRHEYIDGFVYAMAGATKKQAYFSITILEECLLISQEFYEIEVFYRVEYQPNKWQSTLYFW